MCKYTFPDEFVLGPDQMCHPVGRSETIPNQGLMIRDIMARSLRGQILPEVQMNHLQYGPDSSFDSADFEGEDLTDVQENLSYLEARVQQFHQEREKARLEKMSAKEEAK